MSTTPGDAADIVERLAPCPFCGGSARRFTIGADEPSNAGGDVISCCRCGASSHVEFGRKENLVSSWNRRDEIEALRAREAELTTSLFATAGASADHLKRATELQCKLDVAVKAMDHIVSLKRVIMIDVGSCHKLRGPGASYEMRSDDRDMRMDMEEAFVAISAALASIRGEG